MSEQSVRPGRPRNPQADEAILAAARELMAEGGLGNLTVEGTAQRANVAKTTVYRRYPSKLDLAVAAIAALIADPPTGDSVESQTADGVTFFQQSMGSAGSQAAFLAVAGAAATDAEVHERFTETVLNPVARHVEMSIEMAQERGEAARDVPVDFCHDVILGTLIHRLVIRKMPMDDAFAGQFMALVKFLYGDMPD